MNDIRHVRFAVSVDALLQQWARQEAAPAGAAIIASSEIAGRGRGGVEWRHENSVSIGVLARPRALDPAAIELGWLAASLGAATGLDLATGRSHECRWPDQVVGAAHAADGEPLDVAVSAVGHLGPGRIEHIMLIVRIAGTVAEFDPTELAPKVVEEVRVAALLLDEPDRLLERYRQACSTLGGRVSITLLPRGTARGFARDVDHHGSLLLESPTGLVEPVPIATLARVEMIEG